MTTADAFKAALWTALFSFLTLFGTSLLGWLSDVQEWASGSTEAFPDPSTLASAGIAAAVAAMIGLVNFGIRYAQAQTGKGTGPRYGPTG